MFAWLRIIATSPMPHVQHSFPEQSFLIRSSDLGRIGDRMDPGPGEREAGEHSPRPGIGSNCRCSINRNQISVKRTTGRRWPGGVGSI